MLGRIVIQRFGDIGICLHFSCSFREKDENKGMFQAMAEEMKQYQIRQAASQPDAKDTGPKYKAMMEAKKKGKTSGPISPAVQTGPVASILTPTPAPVVAEVPAPVPAPVVAEIPAPVPEPAPVVAQVPAPVPVPAPVVAEIPAPNSVTTAASEPMEETELTKRKIRELQGLFLKHRGGPGFGSGRLRGNEIEQFETTLKSVGAQLRADAGPRSDVAPAVSAPVPATPAPAPPVTAASPAIPVQTTMASAPVPIITPPPRPDTSAMTTFSAGSVDPRLESSFACVEGALQMYKNCPPDIQQGMLMALRAALLSAANSCQQVIEGTVDQSSYAPPPSAAAFAAALGAQDATIEEPGEEPVVVAPVQDALPSGNDSNTLLLRKVYDSLSAASGQGKFGLGPISADEVNS